ncbi:MAG: NUDIX domain-containing protein [Clostridiales bacterium]|jgi:8-oxo-dGTP pyrophosphatase MutT (NUDIX family)|nr:NUDIX domain-containing protein [Clostridiales bacterium]
MSVRNSAKAIIINGGKVLVNKNLNTLGDMAYGLENGDVYYDLPGGGQNQYETLEDAVRRECLEETGYSVEVIRLCAVFEEISVHARFRAEYADYAHKIHFVFLCRLLDKPTGTVTELDIDMQGSEWVGVDEIEKLPLYPELIKVKLASIIISEYPLYLGACYVS